MEYDSDGKLPETSRRNNSALIQASHHVPPAPAQGNIATSAMSATVGTKLWDDSGWTSVQATR
jgi:hypothetical protein